ncbi:hypothetical protein [Riemerella anatipestifer]|uniref:hypothetical protein n=1 Tax=Riemerella anatipestifer TaxID=34085 RepID=UPI0013915BDA|nr:hypothetical protein [Riemerella anatipestifer]
MISQSHPVCVVSNIIDKISIEPLLKAYKKEGNPNYHPKMMLKIMHLYGEYLLQQKDRETHS